ncbi:hypothetical protein FVP45_11345, partial [Mycobacterium tuberculosis]|nr:hypothetical protein [Mycobacterium tuberculosis]NKE40932.1 hypothetical protein [Mycobacterium tuberculosis]
FGVPLVLTYATLGAPFASLNAIATSAETIEQALLAGNYLGAVVAISNEATAWMFGLESVVSTLVKFCDMSRRMEGGIRLVKY